MLWMVKVLKDLRMIKFTSIQCTVGQIRGFCPMGTVQYSTVQYIVVQYSTVQYSTVGILSNIFSNFSKIFFGAKKYFKQKVATQAKSQRGLKIIHRLVQSLWSLIQSYLVVHGGAGATKSSAQDGFWPDIALWTLWPTVHCIAAFICMLIWSI